MLDMRCSVRYLVVSVGALLELKSRGRAEIRWDEWKHHVAILRLGGRGRAAAFCVSGCRLLFVFFTQFSGHGQMEMYDFSMWGRARYLSEEVNQLFGLRYLSSTPGRVPIPQRGLTTLRGGHGSIVFYHVSVIVSFLGKVTKRDIVFRCSVGRRGGAMCPALLDVLMVRQVSRPRSSL